MKHLIVTGHKNSGKTTFIEKMLEDYDGNVYGFSTRIMGKNDDGFRQIYMLSATDVYGKDAIINAPDHARLGVYKNLATGEMHYPEDIKKRFDLGAHNHMADCNMKEHTVHTEVFETLGVDLLTGAYEKACSDPDNSIIVMDELGFMEKDALKFQKMVLKILDSNLRVLGTLRLKGKTPFMEQIRNHANVEIIEITLENRDEIINSKRTEFEHAGQKRA